MRCDEGKKAFASHAQATKAIIRWSWGATWGKNGHNAGKVVRTPIRAYKCSHCDLWHYTSHREHANGREAAEQSFGTRASGDTQRALSAESTKDQRLQDMLRDLGDLA